MTDIQHFVIVYQFGKVASTALVNALNAQSNVEAHQSHFLGEDALKRMVVNATGPNHSAYFRKHMIGQLNTNIELTYQMNRARKGNDGRRLTIVSLSRAPLDWFRSSIQQDIEGHLPDLLALGGNGDQTTRLRRGLDLMIARISQVLQANGGAQSVADELAERGARPFLNRMGNEPEFVKSMVLQALRPLVWFDDHFRKCFDLSLADIPERDGAWVRKAGHTTFVLLRYEDIADRFGPAMGAAGISVAGPIPRANESRSKPHADVIRASFDTDLAHGLGTMLVQSDYARHFGYDGAVPPAPVSSSPAVEPLDQMVPTG